MVIADLSNPSEARNWRFFTDQVMGGVSRGEASLADDAVILRGQVSTANNGGFIQVRRNTAPLPKATTALRITARGDGQTYFVHLRTAATRLPWQYYQAAFEAPETWTEITLPLTAFRPSGSLLPKVPNPASLRSIALVAYGRDHNADVALAEITALTGPEG